MPYDAILFDFDGVLADTEPVHFACWTEILGCYGIKLDWDTYLQHGMGLSDLTLLASLGDLADPPVSVEVLASRLPEKRRRFVDLALERQPMSDVIVEFIKSLFSYQLAVVSSSNRLEIEPLLVHAGVRSCFGALVCGREATHSKPAPDPYLLAAGRLGATRPLVVEDSEAGIASARSAGFDFVRIRHPVETPDAVRAVLGSP